MALPSLPKPFHAIRLLTNLYSTSLYATTVATTQTDHLRILSCITAETTSIEQPQQVDLSKIPRCTIAFIKHSQMVPTHSTHSPHTAHMAHTTSTLISPSYLIKDNSLFQSFGQPSGQNFAADRPSQLLFLKLMDRPSKPTDDGPYMLPTAEFTYNNTQHTATGIAPFFANLGRHPCAQQ
ncbi:hypothetical protein PROFUN_15387 [Planoprotostelium fungivorum]|uniref:Uncharacterized protein n=1 Tax=Planoprotostelium fungivorum TaxID=1890364 RepID=A0A2P6MVE7_9EUKA|nr:hypothetical protein PROFUN_15387 [Planoprotostelium fungivorum]